MPGRNPQEANADIEAAEQSEAGTNMSTADGYIVDDASRLNNCAVEPEMYVEET